jgi:hypothetical protein
MLRAGASRRALIVTQLSRYALAVAVVSALGVATPSLRISGADVPAIAGIAEPADEGAAID